MAEKAELVVAALQQRIGEIVSNYETQVAILRAEITNLLEDREKWQQNASAYSQSLVEKITDPSDADLFRNEE